MFKKLLLAVMALFVGIAANAWTVYFTNPKNWNVVKIYAWNNNYTGKASSWPGTDMTKQSDGTWVYTEAGTIPEKIIFDNGNSGNDNQTGDLVFGSANDGKVFDYYGPAGAQMKEFSIYFDNSIKNWSDVYIYTWDGINEGDWPGKQITDRDSRGYYVYTVKSVSDPSGSSIIWNDGKGGQNGDTQTYNLKFETDAVYTVNGIKTNNYPESIYALGFVGNNTTWDPKQGAELKGKDGVYSGQFDLTNSGDGFSHFSFTESLSDSWEGLGQRYGASADGTEVSNGQYNLGLNPDNAFKAAPGNYTFTVDLVNMTLTVVQNSIIVTYPENLYIIGYVNDGVFAPNSGSELKSIGNGVFEGTFDFTWGENNSDSYFSFTEKLSPSDNWGDMGLRYGASEEDFKVEEGTYNIQFGQNSYQIKPGNYTITVDLSKNQITIKTNKIFDYPENLYLIGTIKDKEWSNQDSQPAHNVDRKNGIYTWDLLDLVLYQRQAGFKFATKQASSANGTDVGTRYGTQTDSDVYIDFGNAMPLHKNDDPTSHDGAFMWYAGGHFNITVDLGSEQPTVTVTAIDFTYPESVYILGNVNGVDDWAQTPSSVEVFGSETGVYEIEDIKIVADKNNSGDAADHGNVIFSTNDEQGASNINWSNVVPRFLPLDNQSVVLNPTFLEPAKAELSINTASSSIAEYAFQIPAAFYDITLDLGANYGKKPVATFWPASVKVTTAFDETDNWQQEGSVDEDELKIVMTTIQNGVYLYLTANTEGAIIKYKTTEVNNINGNTRNMVAAYADSEDIDDLDSYETAGKYGDKDVVWLPVNTTGKLSLYYQNQDGSIRTTPKTYSFTINPGVPTGVEGIEAVEGGEAVFYNLQGVKVDNPENGIYIKVVNGKATKVVL